MNKKEYLCMTLTSKWHAQPSACSSRENPPTLPAKQLPKKEGLKNVFKGFENLTITQTKQKLVKRALASQFS